MSPTTWWSELRRRGVLGALVGYTVVAAGALQLGDVVSHAIDLPASFMRWMVGLAALGLPGTFLVSWFYDLTPKGLVLTAPPAERAPSPQAQNASPGSPQPLTPGSPQPAAPTPQSPQPGWVAPAQPLPLELGPGALLAGPCWMAGQGHAEAEPSFSSCSQSALATASATCSSIVDGPLLRARATGWPFPWARTPWTVTDPYSATASTPALEDGQACSRRSTARSAASATREAA